MSISTYIKIKTCNKFHIKKSEVEFIHISQRVKLSANPAELQAKFAENEEQRADFYRDTTENCNSCLITPTQCDEPRKNPKCINITQVKNWPSHVNSMYKNTMGTCLKGYIKRHYCVRYNP